MKAGVALALASAAVLFTPTAFAQAVALQGMLGSKVLLIVDGSPPRTVAPGDNFKGACCWATLHSARSR